MKATKTEKTDKLLLRKEKILSAAFELFATNGIDTITMNKIAEETGIGVASLYRYYETKDEIAIQTAILIWQITENELLSKLDKTAFEQQTGLVQMKIIFQMFIQLFKTNPRFLRFIYFFDSYIVRQEISKERLKEYEQQISDTKDFILSSLQKGIEDNSIKKDFATDLNTLYFTLTHTIFSTAQKLALSPGILEMDDLSTGVKQLQFLCELLINAIKNN